MTERSHKQKAHGEEGGTDVLGGGASNPCMLFQGRDQKTQGTLDGLRHRGGIRAVSGGKEACGKGRVEQQAKT